jgi:uncharacterized membrane protein
MPASGTSQTATSSAESFPIPVEPRTRRLESIDILRGLLMILMALDHTREYFSIYRINPLSPQESWPALYLTRWVTHLCAPGFIALAGASVYLQRQRGKTPAQLSRLLVTRGLWLIFLEVTLISFAWTFIFPAPILQVIWAIGVCMVGLAALMRLPTAAIGAIGALIILLHNLLDPIGADSLGRFANLWKILHQTGMLLVHGRPVAFAFYPVLAWFGVICLGYAFGPIAASEPRVRRRISLILAASFLAAFTLLRLINHYGDDIKFQHLATLTQTLMSFFNVEKYPPSLEYVLITFAVLLLLYVFFDTATTKAWLPRLRSFIETYGRVPFFYYVPHIYLIHGAALLASMALGQNWHYWVGPAFFLQGDPPGWGVRLVGVYCIWIAVVLTLYLPCLWFSRLKARRRDWWLSYL